MRAPRLESTAVYASPAVRIGAFRVSADHPEFAHAGPIRQHQFVFPRTCMWIQHRGDRAFVADPGLVTLYNSGQPYTRSAIAADGDRSDWYEIAEDLARDVVSTVDPAAAHAEQGPFRRAWVLSSPRLYWTQRRLFERLAAGEPLAALEVEETVVGLLAGALAHGAPGEPRRSAPQPPRRRVAELAQSARAELARGFADPITLRELALRLGGSMFTLCHAFRAECGTSLHAHQNRLRLLSALERLVDRDCDLTDLALDLGFSSHSHFTMQFRRTFGCPPSAVRTQLARHGGRSLLSLAGRLRSDS